MPDDGVIVTAPDTLAVEAPLVVDVAGVSYPAVTIEGNTYVPRAGEGVVTVALSDGSVLVLGPRATWQ